MSYYDPDEAILNRLNDLHRRGAELDRQLKAGELTKDDWRLARKPMLIEQHELEARLAQAEPRHPTPPSAGRRLSRALMLLVLFPVSGIPFVVAIVAESLIAAWLAAEVLGSDFDTVATWAIVVQLVLLGLFALPILIASLLTVLRTGEMPE